MWFDSDNDIVDQGMATARGLTVWSVRLPAFYMGEGHLREQNLYASSYEVMFHQVQPTRFLLAWREGDSLAQELRNSRLERAIGVNYRPETERMSHYFEARLADQFDAVLHFDETRAVEPLESTAGWEAGEVLETFPFAV
jgi:erythromycin esterase-like protein